MVWIKRYWLRISGGAILLWQSVHWLIKAGGDIDFIMSLFGQEGWVKTLVEWIFSPPGWTLPVALVIGFGLIYWDVLRSRARIPAAAPPPPLLVAFDPPNQDQLARQLKALANEQSNVHIEFAAPSHIPLAKTFDSIFKSAGWAVNLTNVPHEAYQHRVYYEGIDISGYNKYLLDAVFEAMKSTGVPSLKKTVLSAGDKVKLGAMNRVYILIGHH